MYVRVKPRPHTHTERGRSFPPQYHILNSQHHCVPKRGTQICMQKKKKTSIFLVRDPPSPCSPTGSLWREIFRLQTQWFINSFIAVGVPKKGALPRNVAKTHSRCPRNPTRAEGQCTVGCGLVPEGDL